MVGSVSLATSLKKLKDSYQETLNSKQDATLLNKKLFGVLNEISSELDQSFDAVIVKEEHLSLLEEITLGAVPKKFSITKTFQLVLIKIYSAIVKFGPGYIIRNLIASFSNHLTTSKHLTVVGKEIIVQILTKIILFRLNDCASSLTDIFQQFNKLLKATSTSNLVEVPLKILLFKAFQGIVALEQGKLTELFPETLKLAIRYGLDRTSAELRIQAFGLLSVMIQNSQNLQTITAESVIPTLVKGMEDESAEVQEIAAKALASVYETQINNYQLKQEQSKIGAARGSDNPNATPTKAGTGGTSALAGARLSLAKLSSLKKVVVEEVYDYRTIIEGTLLKNFHKAAIMNLRAGYLMVIGHLLTSWLFSASQPFNLIEDTEWIVQILFSILQDSSIQSLAYEDSVYFRIRLSFVFRNCFVGHLTESQLIVAAQELVKYCSTIDMNAMMGGGSAATKGENIELYCCLQELFHLVTVLGCSAASTVIDEVITCATLQLRHANFSIRMLAANILARVSLISPGLAVDLLRASLLNLGQQHKQLLTAINSLSAGNNAQRVEGLEEYEDEGSARTEGGGGSGGLNIGGNDTPITTMTRRRSVKGDERLHRLFYFHGHSLTIASILKHEKYIPGGLPAELLDEIITAALEYMSQDLLGTPLAARHIACSLIRAGGLILGGCLSLGFVYIRHRLTEILSIHKNIIQLSATDGGHSSPVPLPSTLAGDSSHANTTPSNVQVVVNSDEQIFEIMALEATLIMVSSLLLYSSEALQYDNNCLFVLMESLEALFRNMKVKYQSYFKHHFRYRTLHIILLEIFTLLPSGSYPNISQQIFIEGLRSFRDGLTAGYECSVQFYQSSQGEEVCDVQLGSGDDYFFRKFLPIGPTQTPATTTNPSSQVLTNEHDLYWKLESSLQVLPKKEFEAYVFLCSKDETLFPFIDVDILAVLSSSSSSLLQKESADHDKLPLHCNSAITRPAQLRDQTSRDRYQQQRKRLSYQSSLLDARIMNVSIQLLAITFPHQLSEYQDKAIQLLSQALIQFNIIPASVITTKEGNKGTANKSNSSSSSSSIVNTLFVSEEEKKKKERKTYIIVKTILLVFQKIIEWFPIHSGKYFDADYSWRQTLIDTLYALLTYPNDFQLRKFAAESLALFAIKWKGSNIISAVCTRIRTSVMSIFEKNKTTSSSLFGSSSSSQNNPVNSYGESTLLVDYTGYVIALTHLFMHSQQAPDVQSLALTTLFDCLKRVDCHVLFTAHVFTALSMICQWHINQLNATTSTAITTNCSQKKRAKSVYIEKDAIIDLLEKNFYFLELFLANVNNVVAEDHHLAYCALLRLLTHSIVLGKVAQITETKPDLIHAFIVQWKFVQYHIWREVISATIDPQTLTLAVDNALSYDQLEKQLLLANLTTKKNYQHFAYQVLLESMEVIVNYHSHSPEGESKEDLLLAPYCITFLLQTLQRADQILLPLSDGSVFSSSTLSRLLSPTLLLSITKSIATGYEKYPTLFASHAFLPFVYLIMELAYKAFARVTFLSLFSAPASSGVEIMHENVPLEDIVMTTQEIMKYCFQIVAGLMTHETTISDTSTVSKEVINPRVTYWILYQRGIIMNAAEKRQRSMSKARRTGAAPSMDQEEDEDRMEGEDKAEEEEGDDPFGSSGNSPLPQKGVAASDDSLARSFETIPQLLQFYRDEVSLQYLPLTLYSNRSFYKSMAIYLINHLLRDLVQSSLWETNKRFHQDLIVARGRLNQLINGGAVTTTKLNQPVSRRTFKMSELLQLPLALASFMNDLLSMACMTSMYAINDKNIHCIQSLGMESLYYLIDLFLQTLDPDILATAATSSSNDLEGGDSTNEKRILSQFQSQILGSIRYSFTLSMHQHTYIHYYAQEILARCVLTGLITDGVMLKRLFKSFITYWEEQVKLRKAWAETVATTNGRNLRYFQKHGCLNEWFSYRQLIYYEHITLRYLLFIALSSTTTINDSLILGAMIPPEDAFFLSYLSTLFGSATAKKGLIKALQDNFGKFSSLFLSHGDEEENPAKDLQSQGLLDLLRYRQHHLGELLQRFTHQGSRSNAGEAVLVKLLRDSSNSDSTDSHHRDWSQNEQLSSDRGGWSYSYFVNFPLLVDSLSSRCTSWVLLNLFSSLAAKSSLLSPAAIQTIWTFCCSEIQELTVTVLSSVSTENVNCLQRALALVLSLIRFNTVGLSQEMKSEASRLIKNYCLLLTDLLRVFIDQLSHSCQASTTTITLQCFLFLSSLLQQTEIVKDLSIAEKTALFQFYLLLLNQHPVFRLLLDSNTGKAEGDEEKARQLSEVIPETSQKIAPIIASTLSSSESNTTILTWKTAMNCFYQIQSGLVAEANTLTKPEDLLRVHTILSLTSSCFTTNDHYSDHLNFLSQRTISGKLLERESQYVLLWLSQSLSLLESTPLPISFVVQQLQLLQGLLDLRQQQSRTAEEQEADKLFEETFETILIGFALKLQSSTIPMMPGFKAYLEVVGTYFKQCSLAGKASPFALQVMNILFPVLISSLLIVSPSDPQTPLPQLDHDLRVWIQKILIYFFHQLAVSYLADGEANTTRELVTLRVFTVYFPTITQQIQYYLNVNNQSGNHLSSSDREHNQQYLVIIGQCLTNIVTKFGLEFRQYLSQFVQPEDKQLLQYVMKLAMTPNLPPIF